MLLDVPPLVEVVTATPSMLPIWSQTVVAFVAVVLSTYLAISADRRKNRLRSARRRHYDSTRALDVRK
jgi:hypothetical protein